MKKLTERQAWILLAEACEEASEEGHCDFYMHGFSCSGLCSGIYYLSHVLGDNTPGRMERRINAAMRKRREEEPAAVYLFPVLPAGHAQRAKFCRQQAAILKRKKVKS